MGCCFFGSEGLFVSIIGGLLVVEIARLTEKLHLTIRMPESVPTMVSESFASDSVCDQHRTGMCRSWIVLGLWSDDVPEDHHEPAKVAPAISSMDSVWAVAIIIFLTQLLWVFGLHGAAITQSVWAAFAIQYATETLQLSLPDWSRPMSLPMVSTSASWVSGSGMTLLLVLMMCRSKAKSLSAVGKIGIVPSIFGINEPIIFGVR
ncbi:MAG: PTS transporter subunit EIIC [Merdibacter sp.]